MKKKIFPRGNHPPPPHQKLNDRPLIKVFEGEIDIFVAMQQIVTSIGS